MHVVATQPIRGGKAGMRGADARYDFVLLALQPLEGGFFLNHSGEKGPHQCGNGAPLLGGPDAGAVIQVIAHRNCDILHNITVAQSQWLCKAVNRADLLLPQRFHGIQPRRAPG
ncbi:MAG TPA: hypothetical protein VFW98_05800, partial [Gemmatimonadaceae bacterium]|nr:hypothetical protein [Gemmatimonadaceae bacterium]